MTKNEAQKIWDQEVKETVKEWRKDFGSKPLDPLWATGSFRAMRPAVIQALQMIDPWRAFQDAVKEEEKHG